MTGRSAADPVLSHLEFLSDVTVGMAVEVYDGTEVVEPREGGWIGHPKLRRRKVWAEVAAVKHYQWIDVTNPYNGKVTRAEGTSLIYVRPDGSEGMITKASHLTVPVLGAR